MKIRSAIALCLAAMLGTGLSAHAATPVPATLGPDSAGQLRIDAGDRCPVCRMFPARNPKMAAAIELRDGRAFYPCGTGCLLEALEHPETHLGVDRGQIRRTLVQEHLGGAPVDAERAHFVSGSDVLGPMGPAPVPLASEADAAAFRAAHGGEAPFQLADRVRAARQASAREDGGALGGEGARNHPKPSWHPLLLLALALQALGLALLAFVGVSAIRRLAGSQGTRDRGPWAARAATLLLGLGALAFLSAVVSASKSLVPGAMCGTGALQAMNGEGGKALALQAVALLALAATWAVDSLRRVRPESPLADASARLSLLSLAVQGAASLGLLKAVLALDPGRPVDCCSLVFGRAAAAPGAGGRLDGAPLLAIAVGLALGVLALAAAGFRRPASKAALGLGVASLAFLPFGALALLRVVSAHWRVPLANECPWCLFLPGQGMVGYPLLGALAVAAWEGVTALAARATAAAEEALGEAGRARVRSAALRAGLAVLVFAALAAWPLR